MERDERDSGDYVRDIDCMGCRTEGVKFAYCNGMCSIRRCVSEKGYETCGDCPSMECCPMVGAVLRHAPGAKTNLLSVGRCPARKGELFKHSSINI